MTDRIHLADGNEIVQHKGVDNRVRAEYQSPFGWDRRLIVTRKAGHVAFEEAKPWAKQIF